MKRHLQFFILINFISFQGILAQFGQLDNSFNESGKVLTVFSEYHSSIHSMVIQPDGKIIVAGTVYNQYDFSQFGMARYNIDGSIDKTFGEQGKVISNFIDSKISLNSMQLQSDGKIVVAGIIYNNFSNSEYVLAGYNNNGTLDQSFGSNGLIKKDLTTVNAIAIQSDDKILAAGFSVENSNRDYNLIRYNLDGTLDSEFGNNGIASLSLGDKDFWYDVALKSNEKIVLIGTAKNSSGNYDSDFTIMQYLNNGTLDKDFGNNGIVTLNQEDVDVARAVKIQQDDKILFVGWSYANSNLENKFKIIRLNSDGSLDHTFGIDGTVILPISLNLSSESLEIQVDGKIVIAGFIPNKDNNDLAVIRLNSNGSHDDTFGNEGVIITHLDGSSQANSILCQPDGLILVGGESGTIGGKNEYSPNFALLRYVSGVELGNQKFNSSQNTFNVFKNSQENISYLTFNLSESKTLSMVLYDTNGRKIKELLKMKSFPSGLNTEKLNFPDSLSKGLYLLNISDGQTHFCVKIVN